ncbi:nitrate- and nitrite sensing domain-containing protein [Streptomyces sp. 35G-GA-8]|uniref:nitrate- and nitrite sensing domain-containing protein n=1 Tax=Streptomyces sp. 35G-GA-8 TaxID=2939434 RepID=UPI00201F4822|nr:nitrate- and nitrite sensing domain-containing protein [Streptomyces sp. 35G-GA-8]MCL7381645.1 nitrate- and nitrite sensing domain-containing protein [Streptomyces sp. 35G-GA-8]
MRAPVQKKRPRGNGVGRDEATSVTTPGTSSVTSATKAGKNKAGNTKGGKKKADRTPGANATAGSVTTDTGKAQEGRRVRVRNRLVAGVAVLGVTVIAAGTPAVLTASTELNDAQNLVVLAELNRQAVILSHSLADERDEVIVYIAAGRAEQPDGSGGKGDKDKHTISDTRSTRVDRQIDEMRATASASPGLLRDLSTVPSIRRTALTGEGSALEAYRAYSEVIAKLQALADELAERTPAEAADGTRAPGALSRAVEQASATRGLLLAALAVPGPTDTAPQYDPITGLPVESGTDADSKKNDQLRDDLSADAQKAHVRELGALADFDQSADTEARESLTGTVTGPEIKTAEGYLTRLTDRPQLSDSDREADQEKVESALSARIDQMRGVESGLGTSQLERLEGLRDDAVTGLELRIALLGGCLLIAVGVSTAVARTLTRPLAVVRIGAARLSAAPETEDPVRFTGRNDEFAQVVRSLNSLHSKLLDLSTRAGELDRERLGLIGAREKIVAQRAELQERTTELTAQLQRLRHTVHHTFVNLSLRNLGLVERQLGVIEALEEREQDPEQLATLFKLDHMATVMRRHSENLLVLAGHEHGHGSTGPVPLVDVLRAAVSEIERYERITIQSLPPHAQVAGFAADDLSHLVAELLENATSFSPPDAEVQLSGWLLETGEVMLSVQDQGIGMSADRLTALNARLAEPQGPEGLDDTPRKPFVSDPEGEGLGLRVAGLLAARHGVRVELREHQQGGVAAVVVLPQALLPASPAASPHRARAAGAAPALNLPGSTAEANSNALPGRSEPARPPADAGSPARPAAPAAPAEAPAPEVDPLVVAAEAAIRRAEAEEAHGASPAERDRTAERERAADTGALAAYGTTTPDPDTAVGPYAIGPDSHERVHDGEPLTIGPDQDTFAMRLPRQPGSAEADPAATTDAAGPERITDKGLPKRTPRIVKPAAAPTGRTGSVDAEALRRRLGGFHKGAKEGRRDVEAELTERSEQSDRAEHAEPRGSAARTEVHTGDTGETVEEARS